MTYPFSQQEFDAAAKTWGCNCGPSALAFACQVKLERARDAIPGFVDKKYTSPTMMKTALATMGRRWWADQPTKDGLFECDGAALVRIQWTGPWTAPGANPRWAYRHTHWIATYIDDQRLELVFDCNGGLMLFETWREVIAPALVRSVQRSDGWKPTHIWRLAP